MLEDRWDQIRELGALDDSGVGVPREFWHDSQRVEDWIEEQRRKRDEKYNQTS